MSGKLEKKRKRRQEEERRRRDAARATSRQNWLTAIVVVVVLAVVGGLIWNERRRTDSGDTSPPLTVESFDVPNRNHVEGDVSYQQTPPVGGNHNPVWQNCGVYTSPIIEENAVHSMEHGAVWITYRPDLSADQVAALGDLAAGEQFVLVTPFDGLGDPIVASAWGKQVSVQSDDDPELQRFVRAYTVGPQTPEPGAPCTGGTGEPTA